MQDTRLPKLRKRDIKNTPEEEKKQLFTKHFIAGGVAGIVSRTATAPMDRMKVFYQVSTKNQKMIQVLLEMIKEGGFRSLWRGNLMNVLKTTPKSALRFAFYDKIKTWMRNPARGELIEKMPLTPSERFAAGAAAGIISQTLTFPLEVLKVRLTLRKSGQYSSTFDCIKKIYQTEGSRAFGRGFIATMIAIIPYSGLDLAGYEVIKNYGTEYRGRRLNNRELFIVSCLSCLIAQTISYPLSLIIARMQASTADRRNTKTARQIIYDIWKYEGLLGYYRGLVPNMLKFIPVVSITFVTYEQCIYWMNVAMT